MLVFVDRWKSGKEGQTSHFVVSLVLFEDHDQAEAATDRRIDLIRKELHFPPTFEFKFHSCQPKVRKYFVQEILPYNWFFLGIVINKRKL
jgi:hypothetical protein